MAPITVTPQVPSRRIEPAPGNGIRRYPLDFHMNPLQNGLCAAAGAFGGVFLGRPINQLQNFYFISATPDQLSVPQKNVMFWKALRTTKWFAGHQPFWLEVAGYTGLYTTYHAVDEYIMDPLMYHSCPRGFIAGGLTGTIAALVRHPIDVLRTTAENPGPNGKKFTGPLDVFMTSVKHKPSALLGLYRGFQLAWIASFLQYATMFAIWEFLKVDSVAGHDVTVFTSAWLAVVSGHIAQYPFHYIKQVLYDFNKQKRFGGLTSMQYVKEMRRTRGVTVIWTGFFKTKPLIGAVGAALTLMGYDHTKRLLHSQLHPVKK